jgi:hypothetical protein
VNWPTNAQFAAALRYAGTAAGTIATVGAALGVLTPDQSAALIADMHAVLDDISQLVGDLWKLALLLLPVATFYLAKMGWNSASPKSQIASVQALPQAQVIVTDPELARDIPGVKVEPPK